MLLWGLITCVALIATVALRCAYVITVRRHPPVWERMHKPGSCFYLDEVYAMDLYLQEEKYPDLKRSVEEKVRSNTEGEVQLQPTPVRAGVKATDEKEQVIKYIKDEGPIPVIGRIIPALDDANDIVYVDLFKHAIGSSVGLDQALAWTYGNRAKRVRTARLQELYPGTFVSVLGRFRVTARSETTTTFAAPYGDPIEVSNDLPVVSVTCDTDQLRRRNVPDTFIARCLGKIDRWDPGTRQLVISPVLAIFQ